MISTKTALSLLTLSALSLVFSANCIAKPKAGDVSLHASFVTNAFNYKQDEARKEMPESSQALLDENDFNGSDTDYLNYNLGIGYYISDDLNLGLHYTDGLELNFLSRFLNIFSNNTRVTSDGDLRMLSAEAKYKIAELSPSFDLFASAGIVLNSVSYDINERDEDNITTQLVSDSFNKVGAKVGVGAQWHFSESFSLDLGYSYATFMKVNRTYLALEYRF